jgi:hypothetical protein
MQCPEAPGSTLAGFRPVDPTHCRDLLDAVSSPEPDGETNIVAATIFVPTSCWCRDIQRIIQPFIRSSHRTAQHRLSRKDAIELAKHTNDDDAEGRDGHAVPSIIGMDGLSMEQVNETRLWAGRPHDKSLPGRERQNASSF